MMVSGLLRQNWFAMNLMVFWRQGSNPDEPRNGQVGSDRLDNLINLLENNSFEFQLNKFLSHVSKHFYFKGNLVDVEISDKQMETFQKMNKEILSPVIDEHIKKINKYIIEENN